MIQIRRICKIDLDQIVKIHLEAFPNFFLSSLGPSFLRCYYNSLIKSPDGIGLCALNDDVIVGFSAGSNNANGFHKRLLISNFFPFSFQFLKLLFIRTRAIIRLFNNLEKAPIPHISEDVSELLSIGVSLSAKGTGVGRMLLEEFEKVVAKSEVKIITLTTDYYDNDDVLGFYSRNGYEVHCDFTTYPKRRMYKLIKKLKI